jgi:SAM-dependent methyltransferase
MVQAAQEHFSIDTTPDLVQTRFTAGNAAAWGGVAWPESQLVALVMRHVRPRSGQAVDLGCGAGRHVAFLAAAGFDAFGLDNDPAMIALAQAKGLDVRPGTLQTFDPPADLALVVAWGLLPLADIDDAEARVARLGARYVVADWRTPANSFVTADAEQERPGVRTMRADLPSSHIHGLHYRTHEPAACELPGYRRLTLQTYRLVRGDEVNEWHQTVHERIG